MIPFQTVTLIEELKEESTSPEEKVRNFTVVHDSEDSPDEGETPEPDPKNTDTGKSDSPASDPKDDSTDDHEDD